MECVEITPPAAFLSTKWALLARAPTPRNTIPP